MERPEDIPLLLRHFLNLFSHKFAKKIRGIDRDAQAVLRDYSYPGNVRELQNIMERAVALAEGEELTLADLPLDLQELAASRPARWSTLEEQEKSYIHQSCRSPNTNWGKRPHPGPAPHHPVAQDEKIRPVQILSYPPEVVSRPGTSVPQVRRP